MSFLCFTTDCVLVLAFLFLILCEVSVYVFVRVCGQAKNSIGTTVGIFSNFKSFCVVIAHSFPFLPLLRHLCAPAITLWTQKKSSRQSLTSLYVHMNRAKSYNQHDLAQCSNFHNIHFQNHKKWTWQGSTPQVGNRNLFTSALEVANHSVKIPITQLEINNYGYYRELKLDITKWGNCQVYKQVTNSN